MTFINLWKKTNKKIQVDKIWMENKQKDLWDFLRGLETFNLFGIAFELRIINFWLIPCQFIELLYRFEDFLNKNLWWYLPMTFEASVPRVTHIFIP